MISLKWLRVVALGLMLVLAGCGGGSGDSGGGSSKKVAAGDSGETLTDPRDGKMYRTVKIGKLTWMAENLNFQTGNSWCYKNKNGNCQKYGRLYDWNTAMQACPAGWRLPTREDWNDLVQAAGGGVAGTKLKSKSPDWNGTDDFGFSALPGGYCYTDGSFSYVGTFGGWWSATEHGADRAWRRGMNTGYDGVHEAWDYKGIGSSVRCVRGSGPT